MGKQKEIEIKSRLIRAKKTQTRHSKTLEESSNQVDKKSKKHNLKNLNTFFECQLHTQRLTGFLKAK